MTVLGTDLDRLHRTAGEALRRGLHVSIQPRLYDRSQREVLAHLTRPAERAEALRRDHPGAVTLIAGCEHMLFTPGIVPGATFVQRIANLASGCEFGCCTYRGAPRRGGDGYDIVDYSHDPPVLTGHHVHGERTRAHYLAQMLDVFESERLHSASLYTFIEPDLPFVADPRHDLDTAAFAIVKVTRARPDDPDSPYRWRRKLAFGAVAAQSAAWR